MFQLPIGFGMNSNSVDSEFTTGTENPQCNLASIGDHNFIEHA